MNLRRAGAVLIAGVLALSACGDDGGDDPTLEVPDGVTETTTAGADASSTTLAAESGDPFAAASSFYTDVLGASEPNVEGFEQGDANSGEISVLRTNEGGGAGPAVSRLLLRIVDGEWQVIGAVSDGVVLDAPENGATVPAAPLEVTGSGRGFEGTVQVRAIEASGGAPVDETVVTAGAMESLAPFTATLDLAEVAPGTEVYIVAFNESAADGGIGELTAVLVTVG